MEMKTILLLMAIVFSFQSCSQQEMEQGTGLDTKSREKNFPVKIESVYFENWISGIRGGKSGTDFYIKFGESLPKSILLGRLFFRDKNEVLNPISETLYEARYLNDVYASDDALYKVAGKIRPNEDIPYLPIKPNEAVLEYYEFGEINYHLIKNIDEIELEFPIQ
jgi:hypothetical protein